MRQLSKSEDTINAAIQAAVDRGYALKPLSIPMFEPKALLKFQRAVRRRSLRPVVRHEEQLEGEKK